MRIVRLSGNNYKINFFKLFIIVLIGKLSGQKNCDTNKTLTFFFIKFITLKNHFKVFIAT